MGNGNNFSFCIENGREICALTIIIFRSNFMLCFKTYVKFGLK